ncbi:branched-chain amino acid ABC transporter permease [Eoetvoesiella caeni]|uniref:Amino acid/amide ABC transporter membrane protein 1 (HAAT family) n=2 Tax=Eoetvoesiella caeni TaxID=645616 RepID=A0A366H4M0_9BURK|nr:branched-chain amino acid ABC transporter permease [Eoetvoesiella caeni]NYT56573.1 branched-chain amino acid ABC transporter permease [Eoetvoesiella caeni]RBP36266.1 amino acid/amide ABC transporter membrane protein 1 (HAAT family) [Eoetvoesiella caeni]
MIETLVQGLLLGGLYCLFALGLSLMFGVMRLTNIAQGDLIVLGGFTAIVVAPMLGMSILATGAVLIPLAFVVGYLVQRGILSRALDKDPLPSLVVTFGLAIVIQNGLLEAFSADPRSLASGGLNIQSIHFGEQFAVGTLPLIIFAAAALCTFGMQMLFDKTSLGRAFRAVSDDKEVAELMGLNARTIFAIATGLAFSLIALAGFFQSLRTTVSPADGPQLLLFAFESVIIGGMGSFWGTFVGAMVLGLTQQIGFKVDPAWGIWLGHLVFLVVLFVRPNGLFPKTKG